LQASDLDSRMAKRFLNKDKDNSQTSGKKGYVSNAKHKAAKGHLCIDQRKPGIRRTYTPRTSRAKDDFVFCSWREPFHISLSCHLRQVVLRAGGITHQRWRPSTHRSRIHALIMALSDLSVLVARCDVFNGQGAVM